MSFPRPAGVGDLLTWAGKLIAELERRFVPVDNAYLQGGVLDLLVLDPDDLPAPERPGQLVCVEDDTHGTLLLQSTSDGVWVRVDDRSEYPP